jgi:hypothetical protein
VGDRLARGRWLLATLAMCAWACSPTPDPPEVKHWSLALGDLDRVPLCVWGTAPDNIWIGGGGLASTSRLLLLHYDGLALADVSGDLSGTIWWIHGTAPTDIWAVGEKGLALHWDGARWAPSSTGTDANLFGVWAAAPNDVWAVGGSPSTTGPNDVLLHYDGSVWAPVAPPRMLGATYFKIWGLSPTDLHVVASAGLALHYDGSSWKEVATDARATLFTVHGGPAGLRAIGGPPATVLLWDGRVWKPEPVPVEMSGAMTGIFVDVRGTTFMTGERYQRYERDPSGHFTNDTDAPPFFGDLHAVWGDGRGNAWAVGGNYVALTSADVTPKGLVLRYGD